MCCAAQPPQRPYQGQIGLARSGAALSVSISSARLPASLASTRSPGSAPGTIAPLAATPSPCASSATIESSSSGSAMAGGDQEFPRPRAAPEQDVGEASGRGADVEADEAGGIEPECVERGGKLDPAARDIRVGRLGLDRRVVGQGRGRLRQRDPADADKARRDRSLRPRPARKEAALNENDIRALAHALTPALSREGGPIGRSKNARLSTGYGPG